MILLILGWCVVAFFFAASCKNFANDSNPGWVRVLDGTYALGVSVILFTVMAYFTFF